MGINNIAAQSSRHKASNSAIVCKPTWFEAFGWLDVNLHARHRPPDTHSRCDPLLLLPLLLLPLPLLLLLLLLLLRRRRRRSVRCGRLRAAVAGRRDGAEGHGRAGLCHGVRQLDAGGGKHAARIAQHGRRGRAAADENPPG